MKIMIRTDRKNAGALGIIGMVLGLIVGGYMLAQTFGVLGTAGNKNDVNQVNQQIGLVMQDNAANVKAGQEAVLNQDSVLRQLSTTPYSNKVIALKKDVKAIYEDTATHTFYFVSDDLSGSDLANVVDNANNGESIKESYLVLETNANAGGDSEPYGVILSGGDQGFVGNTRDADAAGFTYRDIYFLLPISKETEMLKVQDANTTTITKIYKDVSVKNDVMTNKAIVVKMNPYVK